MTIRNHFDIEALRKIGHIVAETLELMKESIEKGITTLDQAASSIERAKLLRTRRIAMDLKPFAI